MLQAVISAGCFSQTTATLAHQGFNQELARAARPSTVKWNYGSSVVLA
jgi:hypothetical protein